MNDSDSRLQQTKLAVEMEFDSGQRMLGSVFVSRQQRLPDLLNDERAFLPFETSEGLIKILRKSTIRSVTPLHQVTLPMSTTDPYEILGVAPSISDDDLRNLYHRKVQETHPDKLVSMGLPLEFVQLANEKIARINDAYDRIKEQRGNQKQAQPKWYPGG